MKKLLVLALLFALLAGLATACDTPDLTPTPDPTPAPTPIISPSGEVLSPELAERIIEDFAGEHNHGGVYIYRYYGHYSGYEAVFFGRVVANTAMRKFTIAGYEFVFGSSQPLHIYKNSEFLAIEDAYEEGWLSKDDVGKIWHQIYSTP